MPMEKGPFLDGTVAYFYEELLNTLSLGGYGEILMTAIAHTGAHHGTSVLEFATGPGANCRRFLKLIGKSPYVGIDISQGMKKRFYRRCGGRDNVRFIETSITEPFDLHEKFDIVFISFAFHGFPYEQQKTIMENAYRHVKKDGRFCIFDYGTFDLETAHPIMQVIFRAIECPHAYNFIKLDLRKMARNVGFTQYKEWFPLNAPYLRLACMKK